MKTARTAATAALLLSTGLAVAMDPPGFTSTGVTPYNAEPSWDGGVFVNVDEDADLEFVMHGRGRIYAYNMDGTIVPGWPLITPHLSSFGAPAFGDIDGDGDEEFVSAEFRFGIDSLITVTNTDGTFDENFGIFGSALVQGMSKGLSLADLDKDGDMEILVNGNVGGIGLLSVVNGDGSPYANFPPFSFGVLGSGAIPAAGDIDNDGDIEIVVPSFFTLYAFETDGTIMPGFPLNTPDPTHAFNYASCSLVDLDGDNDLEIVVATQIELQDPSGINTAPQIIALHHDGTNVAGWPQRLPIPDIDQQGGGATGMNAPVAIADIDGDGGYDILAGDVTLSPTPSNVIMAWDSAGNAKPGFPATQLPATQQPIGIADIDDDGKMEIFRDNNLAANPPIVIDDDGTVLTNGWDFPTLDGSGMTNFADMDGDGFMEMVVVANNITTAVQGSRLFFYSSDTIPYSDDRAPLRAAQYNNYRDGQVPALGSAAPACVADITGPAQDGIPDTVVDASDLTFFLDAYIAQFGTAGGGGPNGFNADLTGPAQDGNPDNTVDASDLTFFLDNYIAFFGNCPTS